jgi:hypothetical protein
MFKKITGVLGLMGIPLALTGVALSASGIRELGTFILIAGTAIFGIFAILAIRKSD